MVSTLFSRLAKIALITSSALSCLMLAGTMHDSVKTIPVYAASTGTQSNMLKNGFVSQMDTQDSITSGTSWLDDTGRNIQAHGGQIIYDKENQTYYWYGEHKGAPNVMQKGTQENPGIGFGVYSSKDLYHWKNEGLALAVFNNPQFLDGTATKGSPLYVSENSATYKNSKVPTFPTDKVTDASQGKWKSPSNTLSEYTSQTWIDNANALYAGYSEAQKQQMYDEFNWNRVLERPKVLYNEKTHKYVMWWHQDGPRVGHYHTASTGIAISDSPVGPFKYVKTKRPIGQTPGPNDEGTWGQLGEVRDFGVFQDDDGSAYIVYSSTGNKQLVLQKLNDDYTDVTNPSDPKEGQDYEIIGSNYREAPAMFKSGNTYYLITSAQTGWNPNECKYQYKIGSLFGTDTKWSDLTSFAQGQDKGTTYHSQSTWILPYRDSGGNVVQGKFIYMGDRWKSSDLQTSSYVWQPLSLDEKTHKMTMDYAASWNLTKTFGETDYDKAKDALTTAITEAMQKINSGLYTNSSTIKLKDAVDEGNKLLTETATVKQLTDAVTAIKSAQGNLVLNTDYNRAKAALTAAITEAMQKINSGLYTNSSTIKLKDAVDEGNKLLTETATVKQLTDAVTAIKSAQGNLVLKNTTKGNSESHIPANDHDAHAREANKPSKSPGNLPQTGNRINSMISFGALVLLIVIGVTVYKLKQKRCKSTN